MDNSILIGAPNEIMQLILIKVLVSKLLILFAVFDTERLSGLDHSFPLMQCFVIYR